jgi:hypothetical protein
MPDASRLIHKSAFDPATIALMGRIFDEVWASVKPSFEGQRAQEVNLARTALAKAIIHFAGIGRTDATVLKAMALRVLKIPSF